MKRKLIFAVMLLFIGICAMQAANTKTKVTQVSEGVTLTTDVDYIITDATPFTEMASVNIENTKHAVIIITCIQPSEVIKNWLTHIYIKGEPAKSGVNCQVKMYNRGAIILPYAKNFRPLTCYTEKNFVGDSCWSYTEGHSGGYMKNLVDTTLNNHIRSFRLKRGYMVTFALGKGGWGYSRCFIADQSDLEVNLPANMVDRISSYRIFQWQNAHKAGVASCADAAKLKKLGASWGYTWGVGSSLYPDYENVPNHIYEDYPSSAACGQTTASCHMKANNEPGNSSDDTPQSVEVVLDNWQNLMRTGLRLCSETSHDGSMGHLRAFIDSVDARGWRCDLLDLHCYWSGGFSNMESYYNSYGKRPILISEWLWGASWNHNGIFSAAPDGVDSYSLANQQTCYNGTVPILQTLNASKYVERYAYWNGERNCSKILVNDSLTLLGKYYATMDDGLGYNASVQKIPNVVYRSPSNLSSSYDNENRLLTLQWNDPNGDMLDSVAVMCKRPGTAKYVRIASVELKDMNGKSGAAYTYKDSAPNGTNSYRIAIYPIGSKTPQYSNTTSALIISDKAEWNDVTETYIINAGFDNSSDFRNSNLSTGESNHLKATGWTTPCSGSLGASGVFKIGSSYTLNGVSAPSKNAAGQVKGGALGVNQGWTQDNYYTQTIKLPAGTYRLTYAVYNNSSSLNTTTRCGYQIGSKAYVYDNINSFPANKWTISTMNPFTLIDSTAVTLSLGYVSLGGKSTGNPYLFFDYVMLEQADQSNVDDAGDELVWMDVTDSIFTNPGFDVESDFVKANLAKGTFKKAKGWAIVGSGDLGCAGVIGVGSGFTMNDKASPAKNASGTVVGGTAGVSQGWSGECYFKQTVTLPEGIYRMTYAVYNSGSATASFGSRCGYKIGTNAAVYDGLSNVAVGNWSTNQLEEFTLDKEAKVTFSLGFQAAQSTSTSNPYLFFDYIALEKGVLKSEYDKEHATGVQPPSSSLRNASPVAIYNLNGIRQSSLQKGFNMVLLSDGTVKKVLVK